MLVARPLTSWAICFAAAFLAASSGRAGTGGLLYEPPEVFGGLPDMMIGQEDGNDGDVLGVAADIAIGPDGRIYVLDSGFGKVRIYSEDGEHQKSFGTQGEGPGDFNFPYSITFGPDGQLFVGSRGGRIAEFTAEGNYVDELRFSWPGSRDVKSVRVSSQGRVYALCSNVLDRTMIHAFSADGKILRSFCPTFGVGLDDIDTHDEMAYASGRIDVHDDRIYFTQLAPQAIRVYTMDGDLIREFPRSPYGGGRPPDCAKRRR